MIELPRPLAHLRDLTARYPHAWKQYDSMRAGRGKGLPDWPAWCWCPMAAAYAIVCPQGRLPMGSPAALDISRLAALGPWRLGQGIYRFDPDLYAAVIETALDRAVPWDPLFRLPEYCIYIETPGMVAEGGRVHGFYAHLECDANDGRTELRLLLDMESSLIPLPLHLIPGGTLLDSMDAALFESARQAGLAQAHVMIPEASAISGEAMQSIKSMVSLVLSLCSQEPDLDGRPIKVQPIKTKKGPRSIPANQPRVWAVGARIGAVLRRAQDEHEVSTGAGAADGHHASPRPHLRKAHWHGFFTGPRTDPSVRKLEIRWLLPILVGARGEDQPAVVHPVVSD